MPWWDFADVQSNVNLHIVRMLEGIFLLGAFHKTMYDMRIYTVWPVSGRAMCPPAENFRGLALS